MLYVNSHSHNDNQINLCYTSADGGKAEGKFRTPFVLTSYHISTSVGHDKVSEYTDLSSITDSSLRNASNNSSSSNWSIAGVSDRVSPKGTGLRPGGRLYARLMQVPAD